MSEENTNEEEEIMPDQKMALSHLNSIDDNDLLSDFDSSEEGSTMDVEDEVSPPSTAAPTAGASNPSEGPTPAQQENSRGVS